MLRKLPRCCKSSNNTVRAPHAVAACAKNAPVGLLLTGERLPSHRRRTPLLRISAASTNADDLSKMVAAFSADSEYVAVMRGSCPHRRRQATTMFFAAILVRGLPVWYFPSS